MAGKKNNYLVGKFALSIDDKGYFKHEKGGYRIIAVISDRLAVMRWRDPTHVFHREEVMPLSFLKGCKIFNSYPEFAGALAEADRKEQALNNSNPDEDEEGD